MTRAARINARLPSALAGKVAKVRMQTRKSTTTIVTEALDRYCAAFEGGGDPADILERTGFVACASGPKDLSLRYKAHLAASLRRKT